MCYYQLSTCLFVASGKTCGGNVNFFQNVYLFLNFINCVLRQHYSEQGNLETTERTIGTTQKHSQPIISTTKQFETSTSIAETIPVTNEPTDKPSESTSMDNNNNNNNKSTSILEKQTSTKEDTQVPTENSKSTSTPEEKTSDRGNKQTTSVSLTLSILLICVLKLS